jgi:hypothetical protein
MLDNAEFSYNNSTYAIIEVSSFFALYRYHPNIEYFIKEEVPKSNVLIVREREEEMVEIRKTLGE